MRKLIFIIALVISLVAVSWVTPAKCASGCVSVTTTDVQGGCVVEQTTTCCSGLPEGAIACIVTTKNVYCPPIIN